MHDPALRRCWALYLESSEEVAFDVNAFLAGRDPRRRTRHWVALAPHLDAPVTVEEAAILALGSLSEAQWTAYAEVAARISEPVLQVLIDAGLVFQRDRPTPAHLRDLALRDAQWHPLLATTHAFTRWSGVDSIEAQQASGIHSTADMMQAVGPPPSHYRRREDAGARIDLDRPRDADLDVLLRRRATCRNFDVSTPLARAALASVLHRTFGEQAQETIEPGAVALKKNHPSGGGLHPLEAYLLVRRVEDMAAGLYHYNVEAHALDRLPAPPAFDPDAFAHTMVAGQHYFADAAVLLVVAARFPRSFWKYRRHPKIYRAILLEAGHASQNLYLAATEIGLGAYVTAAINEVEIEQAFGLDPLFEGPIAVCGFGPRAELRTTVELDPAGQVWDAEGRLNRSR
ncbi:MAG: putative peptide maturation dehydrogenase [Dokdonella sp.]|uniref:putative peptide maturation dehydrogenase n=1 Tax=Dokdonella sp. TaxID=2291710 RepID=UPI003F7E1F90